MLAASCPLAAWLAATASLDVFLIAFSALDWLERLNANAGGWLLR